MSLVSCPECNRQVSERAEACPHCGYPLAKAANPYQPPREAITPRNGNERWPYFQYGLMLGAFPMAMTGIAILLRSRGWQFSDEVLGAGTAICILPAALLLAYSLIDRFALNRGKPVSRVRINTWMVLALLGAAVVWLVVGVAFGQHLTV